MKADEFIISIRALRPSTEQYRALGVSRDFIDDYASRFNMELLNLDYYNSSLESLIYNYDLTNLRIGLIEFMKPEPIDQNITLFARLELDFLALDKSDFLIKYLAAGDFHPIQVVSRNNDYFLDILYQIFKLSHDALFYSKDDPCSVAKNLSHLSEVPESVGFYKMMVGCFE